MAITLDKFISNLEQLQDQVLVNTPDIINEELPVIEQENRERIAKGKDINGKDIKYSKTRVSPLNGKKTYTKSYSRKKEKLGGNTGIVDLKLKGSYTNQIEAEREGNLIITQSADPNAGKVKGLDAGYPNHIGLPTKQRQGLLERVAKKVGVLSISKMIQK